MPVSATNAGMHPISKNEKGGWCRALSKGFTYVAKNCMYLGIAVSFVWIAVSVADLVGVIENTLQETNPILADVKQVIESQIQPLLTKIMSLEEIVSGKTVPEIEELVGNVNAAVGQATGVMGNIDAAVGQATDVIFPNVNSLTGEMSNLTREMSNSILGDAAAITNSITDQLVPMAKNVMGDINNTIIRDINYTMVDIKNITEQLKTILLPQIYAVLQNIPGLENQANGTMQSLNDSAIGIEAHVAHMDEELGNIFG